MSSTFVGYTMKTISLKQIQDAYMKLKLIHPDARHIICSYVIAGNKPHECESYCDDNEINAGRMLLRWMKDNEVSNRVIFVVRHYGGLKMGLDRYDCIRQAAELALKKDDIEINTADSEEQQTGRTPSSFTLIQRKRNGPGKQSLSHKRGTLRKYQARGGIQNKRGGRGAHNTKG